MTDAAPAVHSNTALLWLSSAGVLVLFVALPIMPGVLWALLIGYWMYPLHRRLSAGMRAGPSAGLSTALLVAVAILPSIWPVESTQLVWTWAQESLPSTVDLTLTRLHGIAGSLPFLGDTLHAALPRSVREIDRIGMGPGSANAIGGIFHAVRRELQRGTDVEAPSGAMLQCYTDLSVLLFLRTTDVRNLLRKEVHSDTSRFRTRCCTPTYRQLRGTSARWDLTRSRWNSRFRLKC